ncbi:MAG: hypothetical protein KUG69_01525 [Marinosulfonomonas sp.]|nr:hypothetical protein [Marinosulfonomonas sp.]
MSKTRREIALTFSLIFLVGLILFNAFDYSGDFAINDDWGYSTPIRWWLELGELRLTHWQSMPLVSQLGSGIIWSELLGFSHGNLRKLTLLYALLSCGTIYFIGRLLSLPKSLSAVGAFLPLASPVFVGLSYTSMTDVPSAALVLLCLLMFVRHFYSNSGNSHFFLIGVVIMVLAVAQRQTAIGVALAFLVAESMVRGFGTGPLIRGVLTFLTALVAYLAVTEILKQATGLPTAYFVKSNALREWASDMISGNFVALFQSVRAMLIFSANFGIFLLPLAPILLQSIFVQPFIRKPLRLIVSAGFAAGLLTLLSLLLGAAVLSDTIGNILTHEGVGPRLIEGSATQHGIWGNILTFIGHFVATVTLISVVLGFLARRLSCSPLDKSTKGAVTLLLLSAVIIYAPHTMAYAVVFDRYSLLPSILVSIAVLRLIEFDYSNKRILQYSIGLASVLFLMSLFLVSDFFRWQDARYRLIARLVSEGQIAANEIDGGFEYNNLTAIENNPATAVSMVRVDAVNRKTRLSKSLGLDDELVDSEKYHGLFGFGTIFAVR